MKKRRSSETCACFSANIDFIQQRNLFVIVATVDPSHHDSNNIIDSVKNRADGQTLIFRLTEKYEEKIRGFFLRLAPGVIY